MTGSDNTRNRMPTTGHMRQARHPSCLALFYPFFTPVKALMHKILLAVVATRKIK